MARPSTVARGPTAPCSGSRLAGTPSISCITSTTGMEHPPRAVSSWPRTDISTAPPTEEAPTAAARSSGLPGTAPRSPSSTASTTVRVPTPRPASSRAPKGRCTGPRACCSRSRPTVRGSRFFTPSTGATAMASPPRAISSMAPTAPSMEQPAREGSSMAGRSFGLETTLPSSTASISITAPGPMPG
jgi:hypothetical protein